MITMHVECADSDSVSKIFPASGAVVGNMAALSTLTDLASIQSPLDCALEDAVTKEDRENLIHQYLQKLDENEDLKISDFESGE